MKDQIKIVKHTDEKKELHIITNTRTHTSSRKDDNEFQEKSGVT